MQGSNLASASEGVTGVKWPDLLKKEQAWSNDWIKKEKAKFPNLKFGY